MCALVTALVLSSLWLLGPSAHGALIYEGRFGEPGPGVGTLQYPYDVAVDPTTGDIFVVDETGFRIQKYDSKGHFLQSIGTPGTDGSHEADGELWYPNAIVIDPTGTFLYVADTANSRIQVFATTDGGFVRKWGSQGPGNDQMDHPTGIALDDAGNVWVSDHRNHRVMEFTSSGTFIRKFGEFGTGLGQFYGPEGIDVNPLDGHVHVTDDLGRLQEFTPEGAFVVARGVGPEGPFLSFPDEVSIDDYKNLAYVIESGGEGSGENGTRVSLFDLGQTGESSFLGSFRGDSAADTGFGYSPHGVYFSKRGKELFVAAGSATDDKIYRYKTNAKPVITVFRRPSIDPSPAESGKLIFRITHEMMLGTCYVKATGELSTPLKDPFFQGQDFKLHGPRALVRSKKELIYKVPLSKRMVKAIKKTRAHVKLTFKDDEGCPNPVSADLDNYRPVTVSDTY